MRRCVLEHHWLRRIRILCWTLVSERLFQLLFEVIHTAKLSSRRFLFVCACDTTTESSGVYIHCRSIYAGNVQPIVHGLRYLRCSVCNTSTMCATMRRDTRVRRVRVRPAGCSSARRVLREVGHRAQRSKPIRQLLCASRKTTSAFTAFATDAASSSVATAESATCATVQHVAQSAERACQREHQRHDRSSRVDALLQLDQSAGAADDDCGLRRLFLSLCARLASVATQRCVGSNHTRTLGDSQLERHVDASNFKASHSTPIVAAATHRLNRGFIFFRKCPRGQQLGRFVYECNLPKYLQCVGFQSDGRILCMESDRSVF